MTTLSLSCSRKIYELLGDTYETERKWVEMTTDGQWDNFSARDARILPDRLKKIGAPNFGETVRLMSAINMAKNWNPWADQTILKKIVILYAEAPTDEYGMAKVSQYLENIL